MQRPGLQQALVSPTSSPQRSGTGPEQKLSLTGHFPYARPHSRYFTHIYTFNPQNHWLQWTISSPFYGGETESQSSCHLLRVTELVELGCEPSRVAPGPML